MKKRIAILGATGSIGKTAIKVVSAHPERFCFALIANYSDLKGLKELIGKYNPDTAICLAEKYYIKQGRIMPFEQDILEKSSLYDDIDIVINGIAGIAGLKPTLAVLNSNARLATANKESFVCAGSIICSARDRLKKEIYPVDSEHNTVWQLLKGNEKDVKSIIITASGGAFRDLPKEELQNVTAADALRHPNWVMGKKVTIDCATLVNKGMEIIEAKYLFNCKNVKAVMHRESIIHAMVELSDNSILAGLSNPDMTLPIQYALSYPDRPEGGVKPIDFTTLRSLNFGGIDTEKFPCFKIACEVSKQGDGAGTAFNAADEVAVNAFLAGEIGYYDIPALISAALDKYGTERGETLEEIFRIDKASREYTLSIINSRRKL